MWLDLQHLHLFCLVSFIYTAKVIVNKLAKKVTALQSGNSNYYNKNNKLHGLRPYLQIPSMVAHIWNSWSHLQMQWYLQYLFILPMCILYWKYDIHKFISLCRSIKVAVYKVHPLAEYVSSVLLTMNLFTVAFIINQ